MRTVKEVSELTGVSVRTLHHYDAIGLLKPTKTTPAGYRLYDITALNRLQHILMFRELQFPLKEIKAILDSPIFDPKEALQQQIRLLELQLEHTKKLISLAREIQEKGVNYMNFHTFHNTEMDQFAAEVKQRWGNTKAYQEYIQKNNEKTSQQQSEITNQFMTLFAQIGSLKQKPPSDQKVQDKIKQLQQFITEHYYHCTDEILSGLGQMYVSDERMKHNIDNMGGDGTADFVKEAILIYCSK